MNNIVYEWKNKNGFSYENGCAYGFFNGIGFSLFEENSEVLLVLSLKSEEKNNYNLVNTAIKAEKLKLKIGDVDGYLSFVFSDIKSEDDISKIIELTTKYALKSGFSVPNGCEYCSCGNNVNFVFSDLAVRPVCDECLQNSKIDSEKMNSSADDYLDPIEDIMQNDYGSFFKGIAGALTGALLGSFVFILVYLLFHYSLIALTVTIGAFSIVGYKLLGGRKNKTFGTLISMIISVITSFFAIFYVQNRIEIEQTGFSIIETIHSPDLQFIINEIIGIISAALGVLIFRSIIAWHNKKLKNK